MKKIIKDFATVPRPILFLIAAVFCIQLIDASSFILFNYYLKDLGYTDKGIANLTAFRYGAIVLFAFPFGLYIKGKNLVPFFKVGSLLTPTITLLIMLCLALDYKAVVPILMFLFGASLILLKVTALPFIILNTPKKHHSEAITLYFQVFSLTAFVAGSSNYLFTSWLPDFFTEDKMLILFGLLGYLSFYFVLKINLTENVSTPIPLRDFAQAYDWRKILWACFPNLIIATGAGLTIPFMNLFFMNVHGVDSQYFSLYGAGSFVLVTIVMLFVPYIRRRFGYHVLIVGFQLAAIVALFVMASTEWYAHWHWAAAIAVTAFLVRQPLMNIASPAVSELTLYYVGEKNQEMIGALNASIWSGSWFFSSIIFGILRANEVAYVHIFLLTVGLYIIATIIYFFLIKSYYQKNLNP